LSDRTLAPDLSGAVAQAGVNPTLEGRALQSPDEQDFYGKTLEEALSWCLVWLMAPELGIGPFLV
jgi:hypothetical protein